MARPDLKLVDTSTGEQMEVEDAPDASLAQRLMEVERDLELSEREVRRHLRVIDNLRRDLRREREEHPERGTVMAVFAEWKMKTGHRRSKMSADRFDAILARIQEGYTPEDFMLAIAGAAFDPFITKAKNGRLTRHDDIELIARTGKGLEGFANRAPVEVQREVARLRAAPEARTPDDENPAQQTLATG